MLLVCILGACIEPYDPPLNDADINHLVVDGFVNTSQGIATVTLTRTRPVKSSEAVPPVTGAFVAIEDDNGSNYPLYETASGFYSGEIHDASIERLYRLVIRTNDNREYASDFITVLETPAIDSVTWSVETDGVEIAVNTHDATGLSRHYRWKYVETYAYHPHFNSLFMFEGDEIIYRPAQESIFTCWKSAESADIKINSTKHLEESVVSRFPIIFIPQGSIRLSVKYSALVQQYALTEEAYDYWLSLERSTEHLGGLFDPLPSEVIGNIHNTKNPLEPVIGFFGGGSVQESRMFMERRELPPYIVGSIHTNPYCELDSVFLSEVGDIHRPTTLLVGGIYAAGAGLVGYTTSIVSCVDCRSMGGVTQEPDFWE